jgi:hypothetical protein
VTVESPVAGKTDHLRARLTPQVGPPVEQMAAPLSKEDQRAYAAGLEAMDQAHIAAAGRLHSLFAG